MSKNINAKGIDSNQKDFGQESDKTATISSTNKATSAKRQVIKKAKKVKESSAVNYKFGGTQSFSLRQLWPLKAYQYSLRRMLKGKAVSFSDVKQAIIELGVGSNMIDSMIYWARCLNILDSNNHVTAFAIKLFGTECLEPITDDLDNLPEDKSKVDPEVASLLKQSIKGFDPYSEYVDTLWLWHYFICSDSSKYTALWFIFNKLNLNTVTKEIIASELKGFLEREHIAGNIKKLPAEKTLKTDIDVAVRTYSPLTRDIGVLRTTVKKLDNVEDISDCPMRELQLLSASVESISANRGLHSSLSPYVFAYCLLDYIGRPKNSIVTYDFNTIAYEVDSPGRVFKLNEESLANYLSKLSEVSSGAISFIEQNGIRQIYCTVTDENSRIKLKQQLLEEVYRNV